jgi:hypothetical protein
MSTQFFLDETDIEILTNLLLRSQQLRRREALCFRIGINPDRLSFIRDTSDYDFCLLLIQHLNQIGEQEALCKLCCKELPSIFRHVKYVSTLNEIAVKLNCNQRLGQQQTILSSNPPPSSSINSFIRLIQNKLVLASAIFLIGLAVFVSYNQNSKLSNANSGYESHQVSDIYKKSLKREPTPSEQKLYATRLKKKEISEDEIINSITRTSSLIQEGRIISLECQGAYKTSFRWLSSHQNSSVTLASSRGSSSKWKVRVIDNKFIALEAQEPVNNLKWLDGRIGDYSVGLAPQIDSQYTGTKWEVNIFDYGVIALDNQGESKWLNGQTGNGSINLAETTEAFFTGTKWKIINALQ